MLLEKGALIPSKTQSTNYYQFNIWGSMSLLDFLLINAKTVKAYSNVHILSLYELSIQGRNKD